MLPRCIDFLHSLNADRTVVALALDHDFAEPSVIADDVSAIVTGLACAGDIPKSERSKSLHDIPLELFTSHAVHDDSFLAFISFTISALSASHISASMFIPRKFISAFLVISRSMFCRVLSDR